MPILSRPDGRQLAYQVIGDPGHPVVFSLHGTPGSRIATHPQVPGICVVAFDRPGYGGSDPQPKRDVAAVAGEVEALADELGVRDFAVFGVSGGGPHALACAALLGDRVTRVASIAGVAPADALGDAWTEGMSPDNVAEFTMAQAGQEALVALLAPLAGQVQARPESMIDLLAEGMPAADLARLNEPVMRQMLIDTMAEGLRTGIQGWVDDDLAFVKAWGFDPATIIAPTLIWHGDADVLVPIAHAHWLHEAVDGSALVTTAGTGHFDALLIAPSVAAWLVSGLAEDLRPGLR
jgi:pimeloyl-ACP methyl ester carboxylesterase